MIPKKKYEITEQNTFLINNKKSSKINDGINKYAGITNEYTEFLDNEYTEFLCMHENLFISTLKMKSFSSPNRNSYLNLGNISTDKLKLSTMKILRFIQ